MKNRIEPEDLKEGTIVVLTERRGAWSSAERWGRISKVTPKGTVTWKSGDVEKTIRPPYRDLRVPTKHEIAVRRWRLNAPRGTVAKAYRSDWQGRDTVRLEVSIVTDSLPEGFDTVDDVIATAVEELKTFQEWYLSRPKENADED